MSDLPIFTRKADEENKKLRTENEQLKQRVEQAEKAIEDMCIVYHCSCDLSNPKETLDNLLRVNAMWTLDPNISKDAANFAIEQQIKVLAWLLDNREQERERVDGFGYDAVISSFDVEQKIVELRAQLETQAAKGE